MNVEIERTRQHQLEGREEKKDAITGKGKGKRTKILPIPTVCRLSLHMQPLIFPTFYSPRRLADYFLPPPSSLYLRGIKKNKRWSVPFHHPCSMINFSSFDQFFSLAWPALLQDKDQVRTRVRVQSKRWGTGKNLARTLQNCERCDGWERRAMAAGETSPTPTHNPLP